MRMWNKRKIKAEAGYWIYFLRGYFCCTDIFLMSLCRITELKNNLMWAVWVNLACHGPDCSSQGQVFLWIRQKLICHIALQAQPWQQRYELLWTDSSIKTEMKLSSAPILCFPATLILLVDKEFNIGACRLRPEQESEGIKCFMLHCTLLIWPLWKYVNKPPQSGGPCNSEIGQL